MDVFVIPLARDRYELYCEPTTDGIPAAPEASGRTITASWTAWMSGDAWRRLFDKWRAGFASALRSAEQRQYRKPEAEQEPAGWLGRMQERMLAWVAERIAEQRLLWNLRNQTDAVAVHPQDMTFEQVMTLITRKLQRDYERHRLWLIIDTVGMVLSWPLVVIPGPNVLLYYFIIRVGGHWFSMRGARHGLRHVSWSGRPCPPLTELREAATLDPAARERRVHDVAARLRLQHLSRFFERVAIRHA